MMERLKRKVKGCCRVKVTGAFPESVLNMCAMQAIELWGLECDDPYALEFYIYENSTDSVKQIVQRCMCQMDIMDTSGGSKLKLFAKNHLGIFIALLVVLIVLGVSSLFIWDIDVYGCEELAKGEVLRALAECGVDCGCYWPAIDTDNVRAKILTRLPELSWMSVNVSSSRAIVLVSERLDKPEIYEESDGADIVATHSGIISRMSVLNGAPAVSTGQSVTAGEVLISGTMESLNGKTRNVRAQGDVIAQTWYELSAVSPMDGEKKTSFGVRYMRYAVKFGKNRYNFYIDGKNTVDGCDKIVHNYKIGVSGLFAFPITLIVEEYRPYKTETLPVSDDNAMGVSLMRCLQDNIRGEILSSSLTSCESDGLCIVTLRAACVENIARVKEYAHDGI